MSLDLRTDLDISLQIDADISEIDAKTETDVHFPDVKIQTPRTNAHLEDTPNTNQASSLQGTPIDARLSNSKNHPPSFGMSNSLCPPQVAINVESSCIMSESEHVEIRVGVEPKSIELSNMSEPDATLKKLSGSANLDQNAQKKSSKIKLTQQPLLTPLILLITSVVVMILCPIFLYCTYTNNATPFVKGVFWALSIVGFLGAVFAIVLMV